MFHMHHHAAYLGMPLQPPSQVHVQHPSVSHPHPLQAQSVTTQSVMSNFHNPTSTADSSVLRPGSAMYAGHHSMEGNGMSHNNTVPLPSIDHVRSGLMSSHQHSRGPNSPHLVPSNLPMEQTSHTAPSPLPLPPHSSHLNLQHTHTHNYPQNGGQQVDNSHAVTTSNNLPPRTEMSLIQSVHAAAAVMASRMGDPGSHYNRDAYTPGPVPVTTASGSSLDAVTRAQQIVSQSGGTMSHHGHSDQMDPVIRDIMRRIDPHATAAQMAKDQMLHQLSLTQVGGSTGNTNHGVDLTQRREMEHMTSGHSSRDMFPEHINLKAEDRKSCPVAPNTQANNVMSVPSDGISSKPHTNNHPKSVPAMENVQYTVSEVPAPGGKSKKKKRKMPLVVFKKKPLLPGENPGTDPKAHALDAERVRVDNSGEIERKSASTLFECQTCGKAFLKRDKLRYHNMTHSDIKPHKCEFCDWSFRRKEHLRRHETTHTGETPFQCDVCDKKFRRNEHLTRHMRTHTGEKPYECVECSAKFTRSEHLHKHSLAHFGEKPYAGKIKKPKTLTTLAPAENTTLPPLPLLPTGADGIMSNIKMEKPVV